MTDRSPEAVLEDGALLLKPLMERHGFSFSVVDRGQGSGGMYAVGEFRRGARRLELHVRHALGLVTYVEGDSRASHARYMRQLGARDCAYPGFSDDPLDGFRHLLADLQRFGAEFLNGPAPFLLETAKLEKQENDDRSADQMVGYVGDERVRSDARRLFREKRYREVSDLYSRLKYPDRLSHAEERMFALARSRTDAT